ncbi:hypothetical protein LOK74_03130 [Brevibacillus humidisoli]|uniref:hypothetical protein n=1 Tax=Brevibacillus humidisoli TaxID=2895522 RepID=UPI001E598E14|nr:hypothetical protein [Brevibacillus humidisoli]UFJ41541.1 hypothetical protein LOK74_03130 [Brevibacillus humidisoli]
MAGVVIFNMINVNGMETNAAVFVGENSASGWDSHNKNQLAVGMNFSAFGAFNSVIGNLYFINDNDVFDTIIKDGLETKGSPTAQI